jgi:hypothetical protein
MELEVVSMVNGRTTCTWLAQAKERVWARNGEERGLLVERRMGLEEGYALARAIEGAQCAALTRAVHTEILGGGVW